MGACNSEETKYYAIILNVLIWLVVFFLVLSATFNTISGILVTMIYTDQ